jgi:hypothetical protein
VQVVPAGVRLQAAQLPAAAAPVGTYYFALFAAPSTQNTISTLNDPTLNGWTYVAIGTNTAQAGRLDGNNFEFNGVNYNAVACPGFAAGTTADFAVAGWSASIGTSWAQAQAWWNSGNGNLGGFPAYFGINPNVANDVLLMTAPGPYNIVFGNTAGLLSGWGLSAYGYIPEPSSFTLAGLGAAALVIFRRRR